MIAQTERVRRAPIRLVVLTCLLAVALVRAGSAAADDPYAEGVSAFKQGDYQQALELFLRARATGRDSAALQYNLGVTYYRLERYDEAARVFQALRSRQPALAAYNLGLVARARGDQALAVQRFREAYRAAGPENRLRSLASTALERYGAAPDEPDALAGGVQMAAGYDDNVSFEPADSREGRDDAFLEGYAWSRYSQRLSGADRLALLGGLYVLGFADHGEYDMVDLTARAAWTRELPGRWEWSMAAQGNRLWQDGSRALDSAAGRVSVERPLARRWRTGVSYTVTRFMAATAYDYLDGTRHEIASMLEYDAPAWGLRLRYAYRRDDRSDFREGERFYSYSPRSHRLSLSADRALGAGWTVGAEVQWRRLRYDDPDVYTVDGDIVRQRREDTYSGVDLDLRRRLGEHWRIFVEYRHSRNDSNIDANEYRRNVIMAGVGWNSR